MRSQYKCLGGLQCLFEAYVKITIEDVILVNLKIATVDEDITQITDHMQLLLCPQAAI